MFSNVGLSLNVMSKAEVELNNKASVLRPWRSACLARPEFAATVVDRDRLIANYSGYADNSVGLVHVYACRTRPLVARGYIKLG
jgi:hypothetical protein